MEVASEQFIALRADMDHIKTDVNKNSRAIRGDNGNPGMVGDIATIKYEIKSFNGKVDKIEANINGFKWLLIGAVALDIVLRLLIP